MSPYIPPIKRFADGDYLRYWYSERSGRVLGQLYQKNGRPVRQPFPYQGPNPASWDQR